MILINIPNPRPSTLLGMATRRKACVAESDPSQSADDLCGCTCRDCEYTWPVFASPSNGLFKNDRSSFIFKKIAPNFATGTISLWKNGSQIAVLNGSSALGTYYPVGTLNGLQYGFQLNWEAVAVEHGYGRFKVKHSGTWLTPFTVESDTFELMPYSNTRADGTVRFIMIHNGLFMRDNWDFTGLNWLQDIRLPGILWQPEPVLETDEILDSSRNIVYVQDQLNVSWLFESELLSRQSWNVIFERLALCGQVTAIDYNICNADSYQAVGAAALKNLRPSDVVDSQDMQGARTRVAAMRFKEINNNRINRLNL